MQQQAARRCGRLWLVLLLLALVSCQQTAEPKASAQPSENPPETNTADTGAAPAKPAGAELSEEERRQHLDSFDYVWKTIHVRHFDPTFGGLDWEALRVEYRPRVEQAQNRDEVRHIMNQMVGRLELTHFGIIKSSTYSAMEDEGADTPEESETDPEASGDESEEVEVSDEEGVPGFDVRVLGGKALVTEVQEDSAAFEAGVRPGWEVVKIQGREVARAIERVGKAYEDSTIKELRLYLTLRNRLHGNVGEKIKVQFRVEGDELQELEVPIEAPRGKHFSLGELSGHVWYESRILDSGVGYIRFNMFLGGEIVSKFSQSIADFRDAKVPGVIIDLRGNPGGMGFFAMAMAGWFFENTGEENSSLELGKMHMRNAPLKFFINPRLNSYRGALAILVDGCSASTAEILAGGLADLGRGRVFGTSSAGAALPSQIVKLPNGDAFQYAVANYTSKSGVVLEGRGVLPNETVRRTRAGLLAGRDEVVEAAEKWLIQEQKSAGEKN